MSRRVRQKISFSLLTLVSLPFLLVCGCSDGPGDHGAQRASQLVLGFSQVAAEANWDTANAESIRKAARDAGIDLRMEDARRSQEKQVATLRSFVRQRVDVIALSPVVETGWEAVLREVRSAGIPVILMDRAIEISDDCRAGARQGLTPMELPTSYCSHSPPAASRHSEVISAARA